MLNTVLLLSSLLAGAVRATPADSARPAAAAEEILRQHVEVIAHDSMGGRDTPSRGLDATAAYMLGVFHRAGLEGRVQWYTAPGGRAPNVYAILRGSHPRLRDEHVLVTAHFDHLGVGEGGDGRILNGADDNGSGAAAVLVVAEAMATAAAAPARSVIFALLSGEERGMLGSAHFVRRPPVPLKRIVANVNIDMIGRNHPDSIGVVGSSTTDLGRSAERVSGRGSSSGLGAMLEPWPELNLFHRSDQINFARKGIPAVFIHAGLHDDYHQASDDTETLDFTKAARVAQFVHDLVLDVASTQARPRWNPEWRRKIAGW